MFIEFFHTGNKEKHHNVKLRCFLLLASEYYHSYVILTHFYILTYSSKPEPVQKAKTCFSFLVYKDFCCLCLVCTIILSIRLITTLGFTTTVYRKILSLWEKQVRRCYVIEHL